MDLKKRINARFGTLSLISAAVLAVLIFADKSLGVPLHLPSFWYRSRVLHLPVCVALFFLAWRLLRNSSENEPPSSGDPLFESVVLFTRPGCHLCDEAKALLQDYADYLPAVESVDVSSDPELLQQYGEVIPVVTFDGREMFRGPLNAALLDRLIKAKLNQRLNE